MRLMSTCGWRQAVRAASGVGSEKREARRHHGDRPGAYLLPNTFFRMSVALARGFARIFASSLATWSNSASTALPTT